MVAIQFMTLIADRQVLGHVGLDAEVQRAEIRHRARERNPFSIQRGAVFEKKDGRQQQLRGQVDHVGSHQRGHHFYNPCQYAHVLFVIVAERQVDMQFSILKMVMSINVEFIREVGALNWLQRTFFRQFSKRILRKDNAIVLPTGLRMRLPRTSKFATEVFITRSNVDWGSEELFANHLDASGAVLDIGANIGYYSLYVLPRISEVHAFEPDPRALAVLQSNLAGHSNAHVHNLAVGNCTGRSLFALEQTSEVSHLVGPSTEPGMELQEVEVTTIDNFVADRNLHVTGIKIDVEGADLDVIEGGLKTLGSQSPLVLTETKPDERLLNLIRPLGYRVFAFVKHPNTVQFMFQEIVSEGNFQTKMLFLVPMRLQSTFEILPAGKSSKTV